ncbi:NACHT and WD repeat domain-containing protein 2 isoform X1 [Leguminivora glycinivorella]|uniref:NACHT and WD repeat domain-containing protein 2 isoform X1 n=1 Tax=Leguminivora glycinivorella TaxID=1035111 RepID=UPI00201036E1|nr:NACHT and WD repeat domain-containing protein 2 isoform X1 [Leguminivora glycinivorella]
MGNSCSSGQAHKDKDSQSQHSEEYKLKSSTGNERSPSYRQRAKEREDQPAPTQLLEPAPAHRPQLKGPRPVGSSVSDSISLSSPVTCASPRDAEGPPMPSGVASLPEDHRAQLLGRPQQRTRRKKAMLIYVCAADSQDCCAEKGALQCGAAARLRVRARRRGWRIHVADLHWRSPLEQQRDHRFPVLCIAELARQSELGAVVPVLFLNSGLGTPLLPHTLECADFKAALDAAQDEADKTLLNKWYSLDESRTPPCYRLVRGAPARWRREMAKALNVLVRTLPQEACDAYLTTVVEQEVQHTVLLSVEAARRCVWVCRAGAAAAAESDAPDPAHHQELTRRLHNLQKDLKLHLSERNIIRASVRGRSAPGGEDEYTEGVRSALGERLDALLDTLIGESEAPAGVNGIPTSLFDELNEHLTFCQKSAQSTSNREITLNELKTYVTGDSQVPLALIGGAGCGKATLVARAATLAPTWQQDLAVIIRFVGLTPQSSSSHQLLKSIVDQCHVLHAGTPYRGRNDVASLSAALPKLLGALGRARPALLLVVGADALRGARWLPSRLPGNVKMIVTVTEEKDEPSSSAIMAVLSSEDGPKVVRAPPVGAEEARAVLAACAAAYSKTGAASPPDAAVKAVQKCTIPLYAKILAWQISLSAETFTEQSEPETAPELVICEDLEGQLTQILITTEAALGAERVKTCLALLTAARRGLDDTEILDMLAHDELFRSEETYLPWAPASLFWPQLAALLSPWLRWDARGAARWRDAALAGAARDRYLQDCEDQVRRTLVDYYEGVWYTENDPKMAGRLISQENKFSDECYNTRKLDELPFQHYHLSKNDPESFATRPYFTELSWVHDKLAATDCGHFLEDIALVHLDPLPEHIEILKEVFEHHSYALDYDHRQFYGLLRTTMEKRQREGTEIKSKIVHSWVEEIWEPPIPTFFPANEEFWRIVETKEKRDLAMVAGFDNKTYDLIVRFDTRGKFVATVSTEREEICVWDVAQCKLVRKITGVTQPINLVPIDEYRCVVLCKRELRVYDLNQGKFVVSLKGVMNQKMPYYGLHDPKHLVALSRNRMYVNLMNIETGDCVTTFKAGEDRFLNSLLVSGDGRVLVCGDETQKPFPLLVWSLTSRKLLYDLRIPHHDFVTSKAAITYEGSYVCVVSRELDEPSPNFIVVYDLQSGTLFKKWKPGCDTVALAISSVDGCVVSGLADTRILVWDLVTGNCRLTLRGHGAAPARLRLARAGGVLLSADDQCRDLSVRLWDLHTGKLIAVYTPPERITSCEVLLGGSVLALALENYKDILCVKLCGPPVDSVTQGRDAEYDDRPYGDPALEGRTFDVRGAETC